MQPCASLSLPSLVRSLLLLCVSWCVCVCRMAQWIMCMCFQLRDRLSVPPVTTLGDADHIPPITSLHHHIITSHHITSCHDPSSHSSTPMHAPCTYLHTLVTHTHVPVWMPTAIHRRVSTVRVRRVRAASHRMMSMGGMRLDVEMWHNMSDAIVQYSHASQPQASLPSAHELHSPLLRLTPPSSAATYLPSSVLILTERRV